MTSNEIAGLYCNCIFSFSRNCQSTFQSGYIISHSHKQCMSDPVPPPGQPFHLNFFNKYMIIPQSHLNLHFPNTTDIEHLFMYLFTLCITFSTKYLWMPLVQFLIGLYSHSWILRALYICKIWVLCLICDVQIFSPSLFILLTRFL